ncbi:biotin-dependent carboxyltransferase family protein [Amycolatopsis jejuensis]|uniref:5-oxoprolinase subunit C family protein n=1 Tax=Amycolatopsis jejuensis TaxID=330084 RepID=UPI0005244D9F|nr:biotin-dependent carboxyltransferase family protein [Amycolatopsis jejuensis]
MITVLTPGLHTLVQDLGRGGYYSMGLPPSGALDRYSHLCANALVGNAPGAATLEITMTGPELHFRDRTTIAVTGGTADLRISGCPRPGWTTHAVGPDETVHIGPISAGARAYLAVRGGIGTPPVLGSRSTYVSAGIGGPTGTALHAGDVLPCGDDLAGREPPCGVSIDHRLRPCPGAASPIRFVEGLCHHRFRPESVTAFRDQAFTVTPVSDRTGYRLEGPKLDFADRTPPFGAGDNPSNVVDVGYPVGSLQVPNGDQVICLLRDAVTGGGYATLGTIVSTDIDVLAQLKAPDQITFEPVGIDRALQLRADRKRRLERVRVSLNLYTHF